MARRPARRERRQRPERLELQHAPVREHLEAAAEVGIGSAGDRGGIFHERRALPPVGGPARVVRDAEFLGRPGLCDLDADEITARLPGRLGKIRERPWHQRVRRQQVAARVVAFRVERKHAVASAGKHGERPWGTRDGPGAPVGQRMRDLDGAFAPQLEAQALLQAGEPLHGLDQGHAFRQHPQRRGIVIRLVRADDILRRMPQPVAAAQVIAVIALLVGRQLEKQVAGRAPP